MQELIKRAKELLADGTVARVLGWKAGDMPWNPEPAYFETEESLKEFVYDGFCGANLSKYMIEASKLDGKTLVCLKPCDTYSFNQLIKEHRVDREKAYIIGVGCRGKLDIEKIRETGIKGITDIKGAQIENEADTLTVETLYGEKTVEYKDAMLSRCHVCKGKEHKIYDELIGESRETKDADRFAEVEMIEAMSPEERFAFFQKELELGYEEAVAVTADIWNHLSTGHGDVYGKLQEVIEKYHFQSKEGVRTFSTLLQGVVNSTRMIIYRGHTPNEITVKRPKNNFPNFRTAQPKKNQKIYPNDVCPCGSGKKYKKCCGRN